MRLCRLVPFFVIALLLARCLPVAQAQNETRPQKQGDVQKQAAPLKLIKAPTAPYPDEALKKNIEGKVSLRIVVDAEGRVSDAKVLSGPPELFQAALDSVKQWQFEPPAHAPVVSWAEIGYGHPKKCPGPVSDMGEVTASNRLESKRGTVLEVSDDLDWSLPPYFVEDRKAGASGDMVLSLTVNAKGKVSKAQVVKSLSPHLDEAAIQTARKWRFKLKPGSPGSLPDVFTLHILFQPTCNMEILSKP